MYQSSLPVSSSSITQSFVINQGDGASIIATRLQNAGLIRNRLVFLLVSKQAGMSSKLKAGTFLLSPSQTVKEIVIKLTQGGSHDYWLKIIDGSRREEIISSFPSEAVFDRLDFLTATSDLEGYLFPDSYLIPSHYDLSQVLAVIKKNFQDKFAEAQKSATTIELSQAEAVTFASLLEREGRSLKSKQEIAGVLYNRLRIGMALQVDATVQYARDSQPTQKSYWRPVTKADLSIKSPFNTYLNPGLPPSPICNPGFNSLYATFHPIDSEFLFYITGKDGVMRYAKTLDEHNTNIAKYLR